MSGDSFSLSDGRSSHPLLRSLTGLSPSVRLDDTRLLVDFDLSDLSLTLLSPRIERVFIDTVSGEMRLDGPLISLSHYTNSSSSGDPFINASTNHPYSNSSTISPYSNSSSNDGLSAAMEFLTRLYITDDGVSLLRDDGSVQLQIQELVKFVYIDDSYLTARLGDTSTRLIVPSGKSVTICLSLLKASLLHTSVCQ